MQFLGLSRKDSVNLKQASGTHASGNAHRDHAPLGFAAAAFEQQVAHQARAGHAKRVADRDGAAVDIEPLAGNAQLALAIQRLRGKGLVHLPQVDVLHCEAVARQQLGHGKHRADAHFVGLATGYGKTAEGPQG